MFVKAIHVVDNDADRTPANDIVLFPIWLIIVFCEYDNQLDVLVDVFKYDTLFPFKDTDTLFGL